LTLSSLWILSSYGYSDILILQGSLYQISLNEVVVKIILARTITKRPSCESRNIIPQIGEQATRKNVIDLAKRTEKEGFDSLWVLERLLWPLKPLYSIS